MKYVGIGFLALLLAASCSKNKLYELTTYDTIAEGNLSGSGEEGLSNKNIVITSQSEWDELKEQMNTVNDETSSFDTTEINFDQSILVACFDDVRGSGGYTISVDEVKNYKNKLEVFIEKTAPSGPAITVITQPYVICKINIVNKKVDFK